MTPTVPMFSTIGTISATDFQGVNFGASAADLPQWFARVQTAVDILKKGSEDIPLPTRVSPIPLQQMASGDYLKYSQIQLPVSDVKEVPAAIKYTSDVNTSGDTWSVSTGPVELVVSPSKKCNWVSVGTFGPAKVKLQSEGYDSGWLASSNEKNISFPPTSGILTISVDNDEALKGVSHITTADVRFTDYCTYTLTVLPDSAIEVESTPSGTSALIEWRDVNGAWSTSKPSWVWTKEVTFTTGTAATIGQRWMYLEDNSYGIEQGSSMWCGKDGVLFEMFTTPVVSQATDGPDSPQSWKAITGGVASKGIVDVTTMGGETIAQSFSLDGTQKGMRFKMSWILESPISLQITGVDRVITERAPATGRWDASDSNSKVLMDLYLNGAKIDSSTLQLSPGVSRLEVYGIVMGEEFFGYAKVQMTPDSVKALGVTNWYATEVPYSQTYPQAPTFQDAGLKNPSVSLVEGYLITNVLGFSTKPLGTSWQGPDKDYLMHNRGMAQACLLRVPTKANTCRVTLHGGDSTPTVRRISK